MDQLRNFGFLLKSVSKEYTLRFETRAKEISLTLPTCKVLAYLERYEGISQAKLADLTNIEPMMIVRIIDHMEDEGLVKRQPDPADRRAKKLFLTVKSKPILKEIWRLSDLTRTETFAGISQADKKTFLDVLAKLEINLTALVGLN